MVQSQGLTIAKLAAAGSVGVETVRFYQRRRLLDQPEREAGVRRYGSEDVRRLKFIRHAQAAGFTLEQIRELLELDRTEDRHRARALARLQIASLDDKIRELKRARDALRRLASECESGSHGPCPILESFETRP